MRSANPPMTSAGVMMANVIWNMKNRVSGMVAAERVARDADQESLVEAADKTLHGAAIGERRASNPPPATAATRRR